MPEHVHVLLSEPERSSLSQAIKALKQAVSRRFIGEKQAFWQKRYYDHNVRNYDSFVRKLRYIHRNPVKRGLCNSPEDWEWSSFRHCATGVEGIVQIESQWTASRRERAGIAFCIAKSPTTILQRQPSSHSYSRTGQSNGKRIVSILSVEKTWVPRPRPSGQGA